jgi:hypothetical protein
MAAMRRTSPPEHIDDFAASLGRRYPLHAIDRACTRIEETAREKGEAAFPDLGTLLDECRRSASRVVAVVGRALWSISDYRDCVYFDRFLRDMTTPDPAHPHRVVKTQKDVLEAYPSQARKWIAWKNQLAAGSLECPGWCPLCEGTTWVIRFADGSEIDDLRKDAEYVDKRKSEDSMAIRCPRCTRPR